MTRQQCVSLLGVLLHSCGALGPFPRINGFASRKSTFMHCNFDMLAKFFLIAEDEVTNETKTAIFHPYFVKRMLRPLRQKQVAHARTSKGMKINSCILTGVYCFLYLSWCS